MKNTSTTQHYSVDETIININKANKLNTIKDKYVSELSKYVNLFQTHHFLELEKENVAQNSSLSDYNYNKSIETTQSLYNIFSNVDVFHVNKRKEIFSTKILEFAFNKANYKHVFAQFQFPVPQLEFIRSLYKILSLQKKSDYRRKYICYKQENNCPVCIFDYSQLFKICDGNIFFDESNSPLMIRDTFETLLCEKNFHKTISINNDLAEKKILEIEKKLSQPTFSQARAITQHLKRRCNFEASINVHEEQRLLQFIIEYLQQNHNLVKNISIKHDYIRSMANIDGKPAHICESRREFLSEKKDDLPPNLIRYLSLLSDGSEEILQQLAILIARTNLVKQNERKQLAIVPPKLTIIVTPNVSIIKKFLEDLYCESQKFFNSVHDLCSEKSFIEKIYFKVNGGILQICGHGKVNTPEDLKILKKLVGCQPLHKADKTVGRITYIGNCHYVVLLKKQEEILVYKNFFRNLSEVIVLNGNKVQKSEPIPSLEEYDYKWAHTVLATYGLLLLSEGKANSSKKPSPIDVEPTVASFLKECCAVESHADCYADELYLLYRQYVMKKYGIEPIKKVHLVDLLKADGQYQYFRPRHHAKDNRWGFKGIAINKEKQLEYSEISTGFATNQAEGALAKHIKEINKKIYLLLSI